CRVCILVDPLAPPGRRQGAFPPANHEEWQWAVPASAAGEVTPSSYGLLIPSEVHRTRREKKAIPHGWPPKAAITGSLPAREDRAGSLRVVPVCEGVTSSSSSPLFCLAGTWPVTSAYPGEVMRRPTRTT